jgi:hypothetical protein
MSDRKTKRDRRRRVYRKGLNDKIDILTSCEQV